MCFHARGWAQPQLVKGCALCSQLCSYPHGPTAMAVVSDPFPVLIPFPGAVREVGGGADRGGRGAGVGARTGACVRLRHLYLSASRALALALCHSRYLVLPCLHLTSTNVHPHFVGGAVAQPAGVGPCLQLVVDSTCLPPFAFPRRSGRRCGATCRSGGAPCSASTSTLAATRAWPSCRTSVSL